LFVIGAAMQGPVSGIISAAVNQVAACQTDTGHQAQKLCLTKHTLSPLISRSGIYTKMAVIAGGNGDNVPANAMTANMQY
jgi:hypothetical protein